MTAMMLATGHKLNKRYQVTKELAQGGFGATFLAEDWHLPEHPLCVVKQLKPPSTDSEELAVARRLFETEAQILHELGTHDRIPQLFAYFEEQQEFYLVEKYIEGQSLREEIQHKGQLSPEEVSGLLQEILEILVFVHHNQVIHRDLNPSNLIRRAADGKLCLIDFGAVKRVTTKLISTSGGATIAIGTQGYLPSEQAQGRPQFSSDIYAVGMIGIEALTGQLPHTLNADPQTGEVIWRDLVSVDDEFAHILDKMIRHDFRERYNSAQDALEALKTLGQEPTNTLIVAPKTAVPSQLLTQLPLSLPLQNLQRGRSAMAIGLGLGLTALIGLGLSINLGLQWWSLRQATAQELRQGQLYQERNQPEQALASYQEVLNIRPEHEEALLGKAEVLQQLNRQDDALANYEQLLTLNPERWEAWLGTGQILGDRQQYDQALEALAQAIQLNPRQADIWQTKAKIHLQRKETELALESLTALLELDSRLVWAWYEKGWIHHQQRQYSEAIAAYDRALRIDDSDPNLWYQRGNSYFKLEKYDNAQKSYAQVVRLKSNHAPAWYSQGIALENLGRFSNAQVSFGKVTELEPQNDRAWYHLAWNAQQNKEFETAARAYRRTVEIKSDDRDSWRNLANILYGLGNYEAAISAYEQTLNLNSQDGDAWSKLGNSFKALGRYQEAIAAYDRALESKPDDPDILSKQRDAQIQLERQQAQQELKDKAEKVKRRINDLLPWL